jgi:hypothetical protein
MSHDQAVIRALFVGLLPDLAAMRSDASAWHSGRYDAADADERR